MPSAYLWSSDVTPADKSDDGYFCFLQHHKPYFNYAANQGFDVGFEWRKTHIQLQLKKFTATFQEGKTLAGGI